MNISDLEVLGGTGSDFKFCQTSENANKYCLREEFYEVGGKWFWLPIKESCTGHYTAGAQN